MRNVKCTIGVINVFFTFFMQVTFFTFFNVFYFFHVFYFLKNVVKSKVCICKSPARNTLRE